MEVYEVTKAQLLDMCQLGRLTGATAAEVGEYLVVRMLFNMDGTRRSHYVRTNTTFGTQEEATARVAHLVNRPCVGDSYYAYEIWHVVKDGMPMPERVSDHCTVNGEYCGDCQNYDADNDLCKFRRSLAQMRIAGDLDRPKVKRHYYALFAPYGVTAISDGDWAYSFDSKRDRDAWVEDFPVSFDGVPYREVTTLAYIRKHDVPVYAFEGRDFPESQVM